MEHGLEGPPRREKRNDSDGAAAEEQPADGQLGAASAHEPTEERKADEGHGQSPTVAVAGQVSGAKRANGPRHAENYGGAEQPVTNPFASHLLSVDAQPDLRKGALSQAHCDKPLTGGRCVDVNSSFKVLTTTTSLGGTAMKHLILTSFTLATAALLGACGSDEPDRAGDAATVQLADYSITMPDTIAGPLVDLKITNGGEKAHELGIAQLEPGTTLEEAAAFVHAGGEQDEMLIDDPGGTALIGAGATLGYTRALAPGTYVFFCSLPAPGGANHSQNGMIKMFTVTDSNADADDNEPPKADFTVALEDESVVVPTLTAGTHVIAVTNSGTRPHELSIGGVPSDADLSKGAEIVEWIENGQDGPAPLPVDFPGGIKSIEPGVTVALTVTLKAGHTYLFSDNTGDEEVVTFVEIP